MNLHMQKSGKSNKGFYIALGVCLIAVGIAAWTTYDSVVNYATPQDKTQSQTAKTNDTVSGIYVTESSTPKVSSQASSKKPAVSEPAPVSSAPVNKKKAKAKQANADVQKFLYPVEGKTVLRKFSKEPVYYKTMQDYRSHMGVDLSAKSGETVKSAADGIVKKVYKDSRLGNTVIVTHGNVEIHYCGLAETSVKAEETVKQGQTLGTVGTVPIETEEGTHLHVETLKDGKNVDPLTVFD
ncbi:MAG: M23 family metallopeptidase [Oscillospiraceae bacterium]|nr:M23 family metallopeptidase [Oscillospiraceae bacterium]